MMHGPINIRYLRLFCIHSDPGLKSVDLGPS